ncbi:MAG: hypothetical protein K0R70_1956 [Steroidobacteraceae bacterium]|nr:hypothetical protein [Steroidobacteraceae bacterium]
MRTRQFVIEACKHRADRRASLDTTGIDRVEINARAGDLEVRPATGPTLLAQGEACASSEAFLEQTNVALRREGNTLRVDVLVPDEMVGFGVFYATLDLTVSVPASLPVEITDSSGDLLASEVRVVKVTDSSGDIVLRRTQSDVEVWDSSGDTRIEDADGRVQVRDSSGDIVIVGAKDVVIPSDSSGDISIERVAGSVNIEQDSSGDIRVADVGRDFTLLGDSSGEVKVSGVKGETRLP